MAFPGVGTDGGASCPTGAQPLPERGGTLSGAEGCGTCCQEPQPTTAGAAFLPGLSQECKKPRPRPAPAPHRFFLAVADNNFSADGPSPRTLSFNLLLQHFYLAPDEIVVGVTLDYAMNFTPDVSFSDNYGDWGPGETVWWNLDGLKAIAAAAGGSLGVTATATWSGGGSDTLSVITAAISIGWSADRY